jgi:hypothetical protein
MFRGARFVTRMEVFRPDQFDRAAIMRVAFECT